jgi:hypothetical protein
MQGLRQAGYCNFCGHKLAVSALQVARILCQSSGGDGSLSPPATDRGGRRLAHEAGRREEQQLDVARSSPAPVVFWLDPGGASGATILVDAPMHTAAGPGTIYSVKFGRLCP